MKKFFTLVFLFYCLTASSQKYYVRPGGNDGASGLSWTSAFKTLQKALSVATSGQVWVAAGTYYPDVMGSVNSNDRQASFKLKNNVQIYGGFKGNETALSQRNLALYVSILSGDIDQVEGPGSNSYRVVESNRVNNTAVIDGFTIMKGNANYNNYNYDRGGGMYNELSSPVIRNCTFKGNYATYGGGISNVFASPTIINCIFSSNTAYEDGGGLLIAGGLNDTLTKVLNCRFSNNMVADTGFGGGAIGIWSAFVNLTNCTFWKNKAPYGGAMYTNTSYNTRVVNCSFADNESANGEIGYNWESNISFNNSILWSKNTLFSNVRTTIPITYSIVKGGYTGTGNLDKDPWFINSANGDLMIGGCSPAINAGDPGTVTSTVDIDSNSRVVYGRVDMGAYEYQDFSEGSIIYVKKDTSGRKDGSSWENAFNNLQDAIVFSGGCRNKSEIWVTEGTFYPDEGPGIANNDRSATFRMRNNLALRGGFIGTENPSQLDYSRGRTILSGEIQQDSIKDNNSYNIVTCGVVNSSAEIDGFIIQSGYATGPSTWQGRGGGLVITGGGFNPATPIILNCDFIGNNAYEGGAIAAMDASPYIRNCTFTNNLSYGGGAIRHFMSCSSTIVNCTFTGNNAGEGGAIETTDYCYPNIINCKFINNNSGSSGHGGALKNYGGFPNIVNCLFYRNTAGEGCAIYNANGSYQGHVKITNCTFYGHTGTAVITDISASPQITNCIFWGNSTIWAILDYGSPLSSVSYSIVQNTDPLFVGADTLNFRLKAGSPAINTGNNAANTESADMDGNQRIYNNRIDLGPYEYGSPPASASSPPKWFRLNCPDDYEIITENGSCTAKVSFSDAFAATAINGVGTVTITYDPPDGSILAVGTTTITVHAVDSLNNSAICRFYVSVIDTTPPRIGRFGVSEKELFPPNHKMRDVTVYYSDHSICEQYIKSIDISSNEPVISGEAGDTGPDWEIVDDHHIRLRAERLGSGAGRTYSITVTLTNASGQTISRTAEVIVPHNIYKQPGQLGKAEAYITSNNLKVTVIPNPSPDNFKLIIDSGVDKAINMRVTDAEGRLIEERKGISPNTTVIIGSRYQPGVYFAEVIQGTERVGVKIIKHPK